MCDATTAITVGSMLISAGSEYANIRAQNEQAEAIAKAANANYQNQLIALNERAREEGQAAQIEQFERARQGLRERARILTALGEAGITGRSPLREIANSRFQQSYDIGILGEGAENRRYQNQISRQSAFSQTQGIINQANSQIVNPLLSTLRIGASAVRGYTQGQSFGRSLYGT